MPVAGPGWDLTVGEPLEAHVAEGGDGGVEQRELDHVALPVHLPAPEGRSDGRAGVGRSQRVDDRQGVPGGASVDRSAQGHHPRFGLEHGVETGPVGRRTGRAVGRDRDVDQFRVIGPESVGTETEPFHHPGPEVLDHDVAGPHQTPGQFPSLVEPEVDGDAALGPVEGQEHGPPTVAPGRAGPTLVAPIGVLDLDHVGAEIGQLLGAEGAGDDPGEVDDPDPGQRRRCGRRGCRAVSGHRASLHPGRRGDENLAARASVGGTPGPSMHRVGGVGGGRTPVQASYGTRSGSVERSAGRPVTSMT